MEIELIQALLQCVEKYPDGSNNKEWLTRLFQNSLTRQNDIEIDADLIYNATNIENMAASILAIDIKTIVKVRMIQQTITTLWKENKWDSNILERYTMTEKPMISCINTDDQIGSSVNNIEQIGMTATIQSILQQNQPIAVPNDQLTITMQIQSVEPAEEIHVEEVEMVDSEQHKTKIDKSNYEEKTEIKEQQTSIGWQDTLGKDITTIKQYETRNRSFKAGNPYFVTEKANYKLGALMIDVPGNTQKEQILFVANMLKLSKTNNNLIKYEFINGNRWITMGFEYEEDMIFCKDKLDRKERDIIEFIKMPMVQTITRDEKNLNYQQVQQLDQKYKPNIIGDNNRKTKFNKFKITNTKTSFKGGFITANIPGDNRIEQMNLISKTLDLEGDNSLIHSMLFKEYNCLIVYFNKHKDLTNCITEVNTKSKNQVIMIDMSRNQIQRSQKEFTTGSQLQNKKLWQMRKNNW